MTFTTTFTRTNGTTEVKHLTLVQVARKVATLSANGNRPVVTEGNGVTSFSFGEGEIATLSVNGTTAAAIRDAYRRDLNRCTRCGGDGIYKWGAVINGVPQYQGVCFRCGGNGQEPQRPARRDAQPQPVARQCETDGCTATVEGDARFCVDCSERQADEAMRAQPGVLNDGTYTIVYGDDSYFTFRIRVASSGRLQGRRLIEFLSGAQNELDFTAFGFVNDATINVWHRFERGHLVNRAREIEALSRNDRDALEAAGLRYAERSSRCRRCNRVLTVPASLAAGFGPDCADLLGISYGATAPTSGQGRTTRRRRPAADTEQTTVEGTTADADACVTCGGEGCDVCNETGRTLRPAQPTEYADLSDEELEEMAGRAEQAAGRAQDAFENPTGGRSDLRASDRMYRELDRRRAAAGRAYA